MAITPSLIVCFIGDSIILESPFYAIHYTVLNYVVKYSLKLFKPFPL
ncbi:hypothetical protein ACQ27_gp416 [Klebsiella phage K64-1]|nr:hypothetical protein ACQ27_gp416 [Klebsiella phage K64-1]